MEIFYTGTNYHLNSFLDECSNFNMKIILFKKIKNIKEN